MTWQLTVTIRPLRMALRLFALLCLAFLAVVPANRSGSAAAGEGPTLRSRQNAVDAVEAILTQRRVLDPFRRSQLAQVIVGESLSCGLDPLFALAVGDAESRFDHEAVSRTRAMGLFQVVTTTWNREVRRRGLGSRGLEKFNPIHNARIGIGYLCHLRKSFRRPDSLLLAYNQGPGGASDILTGRAEPSQEAQEYGARVWRAYRAILKRAGAGPAGAASVAQMRLLYGSPARTVYVASGGFDIPPTS